MRSFIEFPKIVMSLPGIIRVFIALLSLGLCCLLTLLNFPFPFETSIFVLPTILVAWSFQVRQAFVWLILIIGTIASLTFIKHSIPWPPELLNTFTIGSIVVFFFYSIIAYLRTVAEKLYFLQIKVQKAESECIEKYNKRLKSLGTTIEVVCAYEQMQKVNQLKDDFIVHITHELRTPLTQAYGYLELLNDHRHTLDEETTEIFLRSATDGCHELISLIDNMLDVLSITERMPARRLEYISLKGVIQDALACIDDKAKRHFVIQTDIPSTLMVWSDRFYLRRIFQNLLTNACKYAPQSTTVRMSAVPWTPYQRESEQHLLCVSVQDEGPGIPQDEIADLFGKFHRLKRDCSGSVRGSGLGLYLCKQYVQALGGEIWVESTGVTGEGSCFRFTLYTKAQEHHEGQSDIVEHDHPQTDSVVEPKLQNI